VGYRRAVKYMIMMCGSQQDYAARLANTPPEHATLSHEWYVDVRPILDGIGDLEA
jgi:hypothetical protein